jgi:hypothetical protein
MWGSRRRDSGYNDNDRQGGSTSAATSMATTGTTVLLILASGGLLYGAAQLVSTYGWHGAWNYIWEGDPYPQNHDIHQYLDDLQEIDDALNHEEHDTLIRLEICLAKAKDDTLWQEWTDFDQPPTIDAINPATILATWEQHIADTASNKNSSTQDTSLQSLLAKLSYDLDCWAAKIDSIIIHPIHPTGDEYEYSDDVANNLKQKKKAMSNRIVQMMERTDVLLQFWKEAAVIGNPSLLD